MIDETSNAADARQVREVGRKEKRADQQRSEDLRAMLSMSEGRRILARLLFEDCRLFDSVIHPSGQQFAFLEGRRSIATELFDELLRVDSAAAASLLLEQVKRRV